MNSPVIPKDRPMRSEDWAAGIAERREITSAVAPKTIRRKEGADDRRLRRAFKGERGRDQVDARKAST